MPNQPASQRHQPCTQVPWPEQPLKQSFSQLSSHAWPYAPSTQTQPVVVTPRALPRRLPRPLPPPELRRQRPRPEHARTPHSASESQTASAGRPSRPGRPARYAGRLPGTTGSPLVGAPLAAAPLAREDAKLTSRVPAGAGSPECGVAPGGGARHGRSAWKPSRVATSGVPLRLMNRRGSYFHGNWQP